jgi:hypothetical protein
MIISLHSIGPGTGNEVWFLKSRNWIVEYYADEIHASQGEQKVS